MAKKESYEEMLNKLYKTLNTLEGKLSIVKDDKEVEFEKQDGIEWL